MNQRQFRQSLKLWIGDVCVVARKAESDRRQNFSWLMRFDKQTTITFLFANAICKEEKNSIYIMVPTRTYLYTGSWLHFTTATVLKHYPVLINYCSWQHTKVSHLGITWSANSSSSLRSTFHRILSQVKQSTNS